MVILVSGGREDEKKKQPDSEEETTMTAISFCSIPYGTPSFELAMLSHAIEAIACL